MATSTIDTDTELSAVNSILGSIGQSPVTSITGNALQNPEISLVVNILSEVNKDVQTESWHFNTEYGIKVEPDSNGYFEVPTDAIAYDINDGQADRFRDVVKRNGRLYDLVEHTDVFTAPLKIDKVTLYQFTDVPPPIQRYIIARASRRAASQLVSNTELVKLLRLTEEETRASALEYDCQQGDANFMGWDHESAYRAYQPYKALIR